MFQSSLRVTLRSLLKQHIKLCTYSNQVGMELFSVVQALEKIAPTKLAENWDNVGLLLEPKISKPIHKVFITNDLTEVVLKEAISLGNIGLILSYHPPIFQSFKRLTQSSAKERIVLTCAMAGIAVYSPHTALDNMEGGINDWLLSGIGEGVVSSIGARKTSSGTSNVVKYGGLEYDSLKDLCQTFPRVDLKNEKELWCSDSDLVNLLPLLRKLSSNITVNSSTTVNVVPSGGRILQLSNPVSLPQLVDKVKAHLHLSHLRIATPTDNRPISSVATCAGSGGSVLGGVRADLYFTGEMSHHQVLEATARGTAVILCEHTNTERGYLKEVYTRKLAENLPGVEIIYSEADKDPLQIM